MSTTLSGLKEQRSILKSKVADAQQTLKETLNNNILIKKHSSTIHELIDKQKTRTYGKEEE